MKQLLIALLVPWGLFAVGETPTPNNAVFGGAIVSAEVSGISKLKSPAKELRTLPADAELRNLIIGSWKSDTAELRIKTDGKFMFTEQHPDHAETISGTWELKSGKILYSIEPKTPSAVKESYHHCVVQAHHSGLELKTPSGLVFDFIRSAN